MSLRVVIGGLIWIAALGLILSITVPEDGAAHDPAARLVDFAVSGPRIATVRFPTGTDLRRNDPVFVVDPERYLEPVGLVRAVTTDADGVTVELTIFPESPDLLRKDTAATAFVAPWTAGWVVKTLLPKERLDEITWLLNETVREEGKRIADTLWPQMRLALLDILKLYEEQLPAALQARTDRIQALAEKHRDGVVAETLVPAVEAVVLVKAEEKFRPFLEDVGQELWKKLPIWALGARYVWEGVPGTREGQVQSKFEQYMKDDAMPILRARAPEAMALAREVLKDSLDDPRLRDALTTVAKEVSADPEVAALLRDLAEELVVKNERLREVLKKRWDEGLGEAVKQASSRLESVTKRVVDSIALTEDRKAINPRLARVLRARLLKKDRRWVLLTPGEGAPLTGPVTIEGGLGRE